MSGWSGWGDLVAEANRASWSNWRNAGRDGGPGRIAKRVIGAAQALHSRAWSNEIAATALLDPVLADPRTKMRVDGDGKRYRSVRAWINELAQKDKEVLADWQKRMYAAGLYGDAEPIYGYFDQATAGAFGTLAMEVLRNRNRMTPGQILETLTMSVDLDGDGIPDSVGRSEPTIVTTNPLDLRQTAQAVGADLTGRRIDDAQADSLMAGFTEMELAEGQARIQGGGTTVAAPTPGAYAEQRLRETQAPEIDSYAALGAFNTLLHMVGLAG